MTSKIIIIRVFILILRLLVRLHQLSPMYATQNMQ